MTSRIKAFVWVFFALRLLGAVAAHADMLDGPPPAATKRPITHAQEAQPTGGNTVVGNFTNATGPQADNAVPSCANSGGNRLNYTSGTGFSCGTGIQMLTMSNGAVSISQNTTAYEWSVASTTEAIAQVVAPFAGTFKNMYIAVASIPNTGQTVQATLRINGASSNITCTMTGPAVNCNDTTHTAAVVAGSLIDLQIITSATTGTITGLGGGIEIDP